MVTFGLVSSVFDYLTFGALPLISTPHRTVPDRGSSKSVISRLAMCWSFEQAAVFLQHSGPHPGHPPWLPSRCCSPYSRCGPLGLTPMPLSFLFLLAAILAGYVLTAELAKKYFYANGQT